MKAKVNGTWQEAYLPSKIQSEYFNSDYISVKTCGATGNGVTDDAAAIQTALNNAKGTSGIVVFPRGTYLVKTGLVFHSECTLLFSKGATILRGANYNCVMRPYSTVDTLAYDGVHDVTIIGGTFDAGEGFTQGCAPLALRHCKNIRIIDCTFRHQNVGYHCIELNSSQNVIVEGCVFEDVITNTEAAEMIQIDGAGAYSWYPMDNVDGAATNDHTPCDNIEIKSCLFRSNGLSPCIGNHSSPNNMHTRISIHDNTFEDATGSRGAINFVAVTDKVRIFDNWFKNCSVGVTINNPGGFSLIRNNVFESVTTATVGGTVENNYSI